jgi:predicted nucleic acid-binding protein
MVTRLLQSVSTLDALERVKLAKNARDPKDRTLLAAIYGKAGYLLTGDARHFGHLYGKRIEGLQAMRPAQYFRPPAPPLKGRVSPHSFGWVL